MQKTRAKINISDDGSLMWYYFWGSSRVNYSKKDKACRRIITNMAQRTDRAASPAFRQNSERGIEMDITGIAKSHQADIPGVLADWGIGEQREFREW